MLERDPEQVEKILERVERHKKRQIEEIIGEIERYRPEAEEKGLNFTAPTREQLEKKLPKTNSPMIIFQTWNGSTSSPGTINYDIGIKNPDPFGHIWLFVHLFIGPANMVPNVGEALATVDSRFPRLTLPKFSGLSIAAGATETLSFSIPIPANIEKSNYLGNSFLFLADWHDVGDYTDRSIFVFEIT
jgi:hypothetical protein